MPPSRIAEATLARLFKKARADRWKLTRAQFAAVLDASVSRAFPADRGADPGDSDVEKHLGALHLEDLALACACIVGKDEAWEHFIREFRPALYRSADAIDSTGGAREIADSLYAELYGVTIRDGERRSLFRYFHGRSSLATWLRAVLAQRHVDRIRTMRRTEPLDDQAEHDAPVDGRGASSAPDPDRHRHLALMQSALAQALTRLDPRDRLRLGCYYAQQMTLAQIGRLVGEHEASVSRHLTAARKAIREDIERQLRSEEGLGDAEIEDCFRSVLDDAGPMNLDEMLAVGAGGKKSDADRSK